MSDIAPFNPERIIKVLDKYKVEYVLIGALAARLQGFPRLTADADITPAMNMKNLERLADALKELGALVFTESVPRGLAFDCTAGNLKQAKLWNFVTSAGRLDVAFVPAGTSGYKDLAKEAVRFKVYGTDLFAASIKDIIRTKKAADRPQDRQDIIILKEILRRNKSD